MANRRPPWKIPAVIDPENRRCIQINIPDDPEHIAIFWGVLRGLSDWQRWEREPTKSATLVAQVWREVVYAIEWEDSCMGCCPEPTNERYNSEGQLEVSYDNGATWVVDNTRDDRYSGIISPPLPGADGDEKRCIAATSAQEYTQQNLIDSLTTGMSFAELNAAGVALVALLGVTGIGILIAAFASAVFVAGVSAVQAAFTSEVWTDFKCILFCHIEDDGSFTEAGWNAVKSEILSTFTGVVSAVLYNWVNSIGLVGLTNAARSGFAAAGDCDDCGCTPSCGDPERWINGVVLDTTDNGDGTTTFRVQSELGAELQQAVVWGHRGGATEDCCIYLDAVEISGGVTLCKGYINCNSDGAATIGEPTPGGCYQEIQLFGCFDTTTVFVVDVTFGNAC